ncbi:hypothetical protein I4U23_018034 [Adineta vaga]|nr:hypothetical protein I4U23_018034 [Adineta vaga]
MNMSKRFRRTTPELTTNDDNSENKVGYRQPLIEQLKAQLVHNHIQRTQVRDYSRILHQSNTPASWYKAPVLNRSVYFYDSNYQKHIQQQQPPPPPFMTERPKPKVYSMRTKPLQDSRYSFHQTSFMQNTPVSHSPRTKNMSDFYGSTAITSHQLKQRSIEHFHPPSPDLSQRHPSGRSQLTSVPTLPRINSSKQKSESINIDEKPVIAQPKKQFNPILMPSTS